MHTVFVVQEKCTIIELNRGLRVYFDFYVPDLSKSTSMYLLSIKVDRKHGFKCFKKMCSFVQKNVLFDKSGTYF